MVRLNSFVLTNTAEFISRNSIAGLACLALNRRRLGITLQAVGGALDTGLVGLHGIAFFAGRAGHGARLVTAGGAVGGAGTTDSSVGAVTISAGRAHKNLQGLVKGALITVAGAGCESRGHLVRSGHLKLGGV